jgi:iduronate 2-sulfatase
LFERAYCQQSLCNPSRSSFLTGLRPDSTGITCNSIHFREVNPTVVTLPQSFLQAGYETRDCGKIFHNWHTKEHGDRMSWSAPEFLFYANHGDDKPQLESGDVPPDEATSPKCERRDVPDSAYYDGRVAAEAVKTLNEIQGGPFFLAVGFWKPHSPMNAPAKYWDLYERSAFSEAVTSPPVGCPPVALHGSPEILGAGAGRISFTPPQVAEVRHGYWANTAYMDAQVGKVLDALEQSGVADRTVVVFTSDHGYHLGEYGLWGKLTCFELGARVPLLISTPTLKHRGARAAAPVELVDLYPTLAELCGVAAPEGLQGRSLAPMLPTPRRRSNRRRTPSTRGPSITTAHPRAFRRRWVTAFARRRFVTPSGASGKPAR